MPPKHASRTQGKPPLPPLSKQIDITRPRAPATKAPALPKPPLAVDLKSPFVKEADVGDGLDRDNAKARAPDSKEKAKPMTSAVRAEDRDQSDKARALFEELLTKVGGELEQGLAELEDDIGKSEEEYIAKTWAHGNVLRGWDGFVRRAERDRGGMGSGTATGAPKYRKVKLSDRIFSLSSTTSKFGRENPDVVILKKTIDKKKKKKR